MDTMTCICGVKWEEHQGKDHAFYPKISPALLATLPRGAQFSHADLQPPSEIYITVEDRMRVTLTAGTAGIAVQVLARILRPDGQIIVMQQNLTPPATRVAINFEFDLCEGFLLDVNVTTLTAGIRRGACFADVSLIRGTGTGALSTCNLIDAYVTTNGNQGWPVADNYDSILGEGLIRSVQVGNPAAGADWSVAVPAGARWEVLALNAQLVTSAAVANRAAAVQITDGAAHVLSITAFPGVQAASLTEQYTAMEGGPAVQSGTINNGALPHNCKLLQGFTIGTLTALIQAADQWSAISLLVAEWIEQ